MKESDDMENSGLNPEDDHYIENLAKWFKEKLEKEGIHVEIGAPEDQYTIILNPPKSLVEKMQWAEEAKKKKK